MLYGRASHALMSVFVFFFFQAEDGIRDSSVTGVQTCALPISTGMNPGTLVQAPADPILVEGKFDKALDFDGRSGVYVPIRFLVGFPPSPQPIYIPISTSLDVQSEIRVEAWINVQAFKNVTYNNIVVKCTRND